MIAKNLENITLRIKLLEALSRPLNRRLRRAATSDESIRRLKVRRGLGLSTYSFKKVYSSLGLSTDYQTGSVRDFFLAHH